MPNPMETSRAILEVAAGPAPTVWVESDGHAGERVQVCAHCQQQGDEHADTCAWKIFSQAVLRGVPR